MVAGLGHKWQRKPEAYSTEHSHLGYMYRSGLGCKQQRKAGAWDHTESSCALFAFKHVTTDDCFWFYSSTLAHTHTYHISRSFPPPHFYHPQQDQQFVMGAVLTVHGSSCCFFTTPLDGHVHVPTIIHVILFCNLIGTAWIQAAEVNSFNPPMLSGSFLCMQ